MAKEKTKGKRGSLVKSGTYNFPGVTVELDAHQVRGMQDDSSFGEATNLAWLDGALADVVREEITSWGNRGRNLAAAEHHDNLTAEREDLRERLSEIDRELEPEEGEADGDDAD